MKIVFEANNPSEDVLRGELRLEYFGIDFGQVLRGVAPRVYQDPALFFSRTYLTDALRSLLVNVLKRVAGIGGGSIYVFESGFGGGKTHALLAVYHLFNGVPPPEVADLLKEAGLSSVPKARVVAIDGNDLDPSKAPRTLWGELARQLGRFEKIAEYDSNFQAPTPSVLEEVLGGEPVVILIDELGVYLGRLLSREDYRNIFEQIRGFFRALESVVTAEGARRVLIVTIASEAPHDERVLGVLNDVKEILGRQGRVTLPIKQDEIYMVIKKRLFEHVDERAGEEAARAFYDYYRRRADYFPGKAVDPRYFDKLKSAYPFHPELIDILYERVTSIPAFQKTRGVLRLLALVVRDVWMNKPKDAFFIMPKHVNLSNTAILDDLTNRIGRGDLVLVVHSDIERPDGQAKAQRRGDSTYLEVARAVFLYSLIGVDKPMQQVAPRISDVTLAVATPELTDPGRVETALRELSYELWYLYTDKEGGRYWFSPVPNIKRIIDEVKDAAVERREAAAKVRSEVEQLCRSVKSKMTWFDCLVWQEPEDSPRYKVVFLDPQQYGTEYKRGVVEIPQRLKELYDRMAYKNTVVFLMPLVDKFEQAVEEAKYVVACERLLKMEEYSNYKKELNDHLSRHKGNLIATVIEMYQYMAYPRREGLRDAFIKLPRPPSGAAGDYEIYSKALVDTLKGVPASKLVLEALTPDYLWDVYFNERSQFKEGGAVELRDLLEDFKKDPGLPMVPDEEAILTAVQKLIADGRLAYRGPEGWVFNYTMLPESRVLEEAAKHEAARELLEQFHKNFKKDVRLVERAGSLVNPDKAREEFLSFIKRIEPLLAAAPSGAEARAVEGPQVFEVDKPEGLRPGVFERVELRSDSVYNLGSALMALLNVLRITTGFNATARVSIETDVIKVNLSIEADNKEKLDKALLDAGDIYSKILDKYGNVRCTCDAVVDKLMAKVDREELSILEKALGAVKFKAVIRVDVGKR